MNHKLDVLSTNTFKTMKAFREIFQCMAVGHTVNESSDPSLHFSDSLVLLNQVSNSLSESDGSLADPSLTFSSVS